MQSLMIESLLYIEERREQTYMCAYFLPLAMGYPLSLLKYPNKSNSSLSSSYRGVQYGGEDMVLLIHWTSQNLFRSLFSYLTQDSQPKDHPFRSIKHSERRAHNESPHGSLSDRRVYLLKQIFFWSFTSNIGFQLFFSIDIGSVSFLQSTNGASEPWQELPSILVNSS